ncbi:molybdate ABC transporter substrate-binding protein [Cellulomonas sp. URHD0024]|uniref:molybdate ABC transporter substrate-binding protein n=1 Tax=Cellulomonas sp. URHD0024 TaxID=1302620 RepID=UPI0003F7DCBD|nr:molybdate ABC transporter substrate-binding protein [Cellulomonas sp. URHD0024]
MPRRLAVALVAAAVGLGSASCASGSSDTPSATSSSSLTGDITVLAAASLTESFTTLGRHFEAAHPGVTVRFSFAASSALAQQITDGAPADVFASASATTMRDVVTAGEASDPVVFATNSMEIAVPPTNPAKVTGVHDLTSTAVTTALCQPQVPCGATAAAVFTNAGITVTPVTLEPDVRSVLSKVELGEVDAGVVYVTDVLAAGEKVRGVEIPDDVNASTDYPIAPLAHSTHAEAASAFVDYVLSADGARVLSAAGFRQPGA